MVSGDGGPALFRLVRFWSRRWARGVAAGVEGVDAAVVQHVLTVDAVSTCSARAGEGPTVGDVARRLGLDRSGASRMIAAAVEQGYLRRARTPADARRAALRLTPAGRELVDASRRWQRETFAELTASWSDEDRARFGGYLQRLAEEVGA